MIAVGDQEAQRRFGDRQAQSEEGQRGFQRNGRGHLHRRHDDHRRQAVRQQVPEHDPRRRQREATRRLHVFAALFHQRRAAHRARVVGPLDRDERGDHLARALPQHRDQDQRDEDCRERELDVDDAHHQRLKLPADVGSREAHREPDDQRADRADHADHERNAQPVEDCRQHVAALVVRAEPEASAIGRGRPGRQPAVHDVELRQVVWILRRDDRREDRREHDQRQ